MLLFQHVINILKLLLDIFCSPFFIASPPIPCILHTQHISIPTNQAAGGFWLLLGSPVSVFR